MNTHLIHRSKSLTPVERVEISSGQGHLPNSFLFIPSYTKIGFLIEFPPVIQIV